MSYPLVESVDPTFSSSTIDVAGLDLRATSAGRRKLIVHFLVWSLGLSWAVFGPICYFFLSDAKSDGAQALLIGMMFIPALATWIVNRRHRLNWGGCGLKVRNWRFLPYAIGIVLTYSVTEMVLQHWFGTATYAIPREKYFFALAVLAPVASIATSLFAFGEELGWRGFLQNLLIKEFGVTKGLLILGLSWGLWHLPVALMGYNLPEHPVVEAFLWYPAFCISLSFVFGWLSLAGRSTWWAVLGHGANNGIASMIAGKITILDQDASYMIGAAVFLATGAVFFLLLRRMERSGKIELDA